MDGTSQSIDRIRKARKTGAEMMADLEQVPWTLDPHHTVTQQYDSGAANVPAPKHGSMLGLAPQNDAAEEYDYDAVRQIEEGGESAARQHKYLSGPYVQSVDESLPSWRDPDLAGDRRLEEDHMERMQTGLSPQDWEVSGGMSGQERMAAMAQQRVADDQAKFDNNAQVERRRNAVREQSNREFAEWEAGKAGRIAQAEQERQAIHTERKAKQAQQNATDSDAAFGAKLDADLNPAPDFTADPFAADAQKATAGVGKELIEQEMAGTAAMDSLPVEATPMEAPLPGEETLPPAVAGWAQRRAERGQGGTNALRAAYHREVPEDARSGSDVHSFEGWLARKGIKPDMPIQEAIPILNRLVPMDSQHVERRRDQFVQTYMARHADELAKRGITEEQIRSMYDQGVKADKNGDPIMAGSRAVNGALTGSLKAQKGQQIAMNVKKRADQYNRARSFGVPMGAVQFFDSLQEAKTPQERSNILMLAHRSQPHMGWDKMAAMLMKGEIDNDAMSQWAGRFGGPQQAQSPLDKIRENENAINANWGQPGWEGQARQHVTSIRGQNAKPAEAEADIKQLNINGARPVILSGQQLTPEQKVMAQRAFDGSSIAAFAAQLGLKQDDPRLPQMYYNIFDKAPPASFWGAPGRAVAAGASAISNGIRGMIGSFGQPMAPSAWAAAAPTPPSSLRGPDPFK